MKYRVDVKLTGYETITVDADTPEQACEIACSKFEDYYAVNPAWDLRCKSTETTILE